VTPWLLLAVAVLLVLACGVFVAAEFALVTVDRAKVERDAERGDRAAGGLLSALRSLSRHLSGAQVGITLTNLAIGWLAEPSIADLVDGPLARAGLPSGAVDPTAVVLSLVLSSVATMVFGELVPKNIALALPLETARATQRVLRAFTQAMAAPIAVLNGTANALVRRLGFEPQEELRSARTTSELSSLIQRSADEGTLDADTAELMERSVEFGTRTAGEIMTPRVRQQSLDESDRAQAIIDLTRRTGHSRFPVLDERDNVVGTVHVKTAVALPVQERSTVRVKHLMRPPIFVPESLRLDPLLQQLRKESFQLAVVLDEYGDQAGIVTLEDVIEEIVGDIADEHDALGTRVRSRRDGTWSLSGLLRPDEAEDATGLAIPESEHYDTLGGLVMRELGRIPQRGDSVEITVPGEGDEVPTRRLRVTVERMDGLRVDRVVLRVLDEAGEVRP